MCSAEAEIDWLIRLVTGLRAARSELGVPAAARLSLQVRDAASATRARLERHGEAIRRLARCATIEIATGPAPRGAIQVVLDEATYALPLAGVIDLEQERSRLIGSSRKPSPSSSVSIRSSPIRSSWIERPRR